MISLKQMDEILLDQKNTSATWEDATCKWLLANEPVRDRERRIRRRVLSRQKQQQMPKGGIPWISELREAQMIL